MCIIMWLNCFHPFFAISFCHHQQQQQQQGPPPTPSTTTTTAAATATNAAAGCRAGPDDGPWGIPARTGSYFLPQLHVLWPPGLFPWHDRHASIATRSPAWSVYTHCHVTGLLPGQYILIVMSLVYCLVSIYSLSCHWFIAWSVYTHCHVTGLLPGQYILTVM